MVKALIIVESPAKIKTLRKFLGNQFSFASSVGHIRDLPAKEFGVDIDNDFEPTYVTMSDKENVIKTLQKEAKKADVIYLSPDPDREGEAIAWHILQILPKGKEVKRISFNAITKQAVLKAIDEPRDLDMRLVNAQQARRILDRLVGYSISPLLNRRMQRGREGAVSAGRVQSVALKLVVLREREILAFIPVEYWNIESVVQKEKEKPFKAYVHSVDGVKVEKERLGNKPCYLIDSEEKATKLVKSLENAKHLVTSVEKKEKKRSPVPPFITSTLQQEASRHFGYASSRTMGIAQGLYEGVDGNEGLITYMRTDSTRIDPSALKQARSYLKKEYGASFLPEEPRIYASKKGAQDAHEAIRPTDVWKTPDSLRGKLTEEQWKLYQLIWKRFVASQMMPAIFDTVSVDIEAGNLLLRATGSQQKFAGFLALYQEKQDDTTEEEGGMSLPELDVGEELNLLDVLKQQAFTRPPPRYTEASLVKELEKSGIGRPSTYAQIMNKIQSRDYTTKEQGRLKPTELGIVLNDLLEGNFQHIMEIDFTKKMEDALEEVADQDLDWKELIRSFWQTFSPDLEKAKESLHVPKILTEYTCPKCQEAPLQKVWSKSKYFYGCSRYPDCDFTTPIEEFHFNPKDYNPDFTWEQPCPLCQGEMKVRHGRFGPFLGCLKYPECKGIVNIPKKGEPIFKASDMPECPAKGCEGKMAARKSRFGKIFFSCSSFPECDVIVNDLDQLPIKYPDHPKTAYVKKSKKGAKKKTATKTTATKKATTKKVATKAKAKPKKERKQPEYLLSSKMQAFLGEEKATRQRVLQGVWEYIKANNLQDESNRRQINPDAKLKDLFSVDAPFNMMKVAGFLKDHLAEKVA